MSDAPDTLVGMIDALVEPAAPVPVSLMPQTWGWAVLALAVVGIAGWLILRRARHRHASAYRRAALAELERAGTAADVAAILRRAALVAYPRADVAGLIGTDWVAFLSRTGSTTFPPEELTCAPYVADPGPPSPDLRRAADQWLRSHQGHAP